MGKALERYKSDYKEMTKDVVKEQVVPFGKSVSDLSLPSIRVDGKTYYYWANRMGNEGLPTIASGATVFTKNTADRSYLLTGVIPSDRNIGLRKRDIKETIKNHNKRKGVK